MVMKDTRGQSQVIGFIIIFASLALLAGINQAVIVPSENTDVEFEHHNEIQNEMVDLRDKTLSARVSSANRVSTISLSTNYPTRYIALNPPAPTGTVQTIDPSGNEGNISLNTGSVDLNRVCGVGSNDKVNTTFLEYSAEYNEFGSASPITHENTVIHRGGTNPILDTNQAMIRDNQLWITRFVGDVQKSGTRTESIDLLPSKTGRNFTDSTVNITIPTRLSKETWKQELIDNDDVKVGDAGGDAVWIKIGPDPQLMVRCTTIGYNEQPDVDPVVEPFGDENTSTTINPAGPDTVQLTEIDGDSGEANLTFENNFQSVNLDAVEARIPYTTDPGNNKGSVITVQGNDVPVRAGPINIRPIEFPSGNTTFVDVETDDLNLKQSGFVLELKFQDQDGQTIARYQYFVST